MRRPQVGELGEQIAVGPHPILRHLPICEDSKEGIDGVVGERPAIVWKGRRARWVVGQKVLAYRDVNLGQILLVPFSFCPLTCRVGCECTLRNAP